MLLDHAHGLAARLNRHTDQTAEHQAAVELLALTAYADKRVTQAELEEFETFDMKHSDWDTGSFSIQQYFPVAIAKARRALAERDGAAHLLQDAASRLTTAAAKAETIEACQALAAADGESDAETTFLRQVESALS